MAATGDGRPGGTPAEVVVVGAGPVGAVAALRLAREGVPVTVLEAGDGTGTESRASTFHPPTLEMLDELGVAENILEQGLIASTYQVRDRREGLIAEFDLSVLRDETRFPFRLQCEQSRLTEAILARLAETSGVEVRFSAPVHDVRPEGDEVVVRYGDDRSPETLRAGWVIGSDGAHSAVRRSLGIEFEGMTYPERFLVVTTPLELKELLPDIAYVNYVADPREWFVLLRIPTAWRVLFPVPEETEDAEVLDESNIQRLMQGVHPRKEPYPIEHTTLYRVHQRVVERFRVGRVLLAGDAAHVNNPLGGMGMNSGVHDAYFLAGALSRVLRGEEGEGALERCARWRREVALRYVAATTDRNWSSIRESESDARRRQHEEWRRIAGSPEATREFLLRSSMLASVRGAA
jgi:3-(3-hydroxy-phenyl)propionate hydroxylase